MPIALLNEHQLVMLQQHHREGANVRRPSPPNDQLAKGPASSVSACSRRARRLLVRLGRCLATGARLAALHARGLADWVVGSTRRRGAAYASLACETASDDDEEAPPPAAAAAAAPVGATCSRLPAASDAEICEKNRALSATQERRLFL